MPNFKLKYGTEKHRKVREALRNRIKAGEFAVSRKTSDYAENEERFRAYMPTQENDAIRKAKHDDGDPQYATIEIPMSYAQLMSWHTYQATVFLSRNPILQFAGRHGETEHQIQAVEAVMDYQTLVGGHMVPYYIWLMDAGKYGAGIVGHYWDEEINQVSEIVEEPVTYLGITITGKSRKVKRTRRVRTYSGNKVFNTRPHDFLFDSRVSLSNFQQGEFCGRKADLGWNTMVKREDSGQYYNLEEVKNFKRRSRYGYHDRDTGSPELDLPDAETGASYLMHDDFQTVDFVSVVELYVELIPKDWGLGDSSYPEKWVFTLAEDEVIIESQPYSSLHSKFPFDVLEYEIEGYGLQKRSMLDVIDPLQDVMTWLVNTHFYNVRNVLNGQFIADPSRLTIKDFRSEGGGRIVRLKPTAYGQDIRTMFHQITTTDVTQNHLRDMQMVNEMIQRVSGVTDNIMGMVNPGGRKTATEVRSSNTAGVNRLKTQAEYFSAMGFTPLAMKMLQNTQQFYDGEAKYKLAGDLMEEAGPQFVEVTPESIAGFYDFVPVDGTLPIDRFAQVTMWTQLMQQIRTMPGLMEQYDMAGIFGWVAQLGGLKNIKRFRLNIRPDEQISRDLERGNVVGLNDVRGNASGNGAASPNSTGVPGAAQLPGLGPSG